MVSTQLVPVVDAPRAPLLLTASLFRTQSTKPVIITTAMITMSKTFTIGKDLEVNRLGFGAMRLTGKGIWGEPKDPEEAQARAETRRRAWC